MAFNPMTVNTPPEAAPHIYAEDDAAVFQSIFGGDGILSVGSRFKTEVKTNNLVRLNDGVLCVGGHLGRIKYADYEDCVIENGETGYNRNDLIIGSFSNNGEHTIDEMKIEVLKGKVTTGTAEDPVVTQGDLYQGEQLRQVPIARVKLEGLNIVSVDMLLPVIPTIPMINMYLSNLTVQKTSTQGGWVVEKYVNGWCKLYIKAQVYRASKEQTVYKLAFPDGMRLKNVRIQMTPAQNGWNVANFYHNTSGQTDDNAVISEAVIVFTAKDTTALTYCFDVCVSGFLV